MIAYNETMAVKIKTYCELKNLGKFLTCATIANMLAESALDPGNAQNKYMTQYGVTDAQYVQLVDKGTWRTPDKYAKPFTTDGIGFGLCQWTSSGRKSGLYNLCRARGVSIADFDTQMDWFYEELTASKSLLNQFAAAQSPEDAAVIFMVKFERPASKDDPKKQKIRADYARYFYDKYYSESEVPMGNKILALSAGHGHYTAGKRIPKQLDPNETREWDMNQKIACLIQDELSNYSGVEVVRMDDPTGNADIPLNTRAAHSDQIKADFYLAIHHNGTKNNQIFSGGGIVAYHYPLDRNKKEATDIYNLLISYTGLKGNRAKPIAPTTEFTEVCKPKADAILVEHGFMTSTVDVPIILSDDFNRKCARAYRDYFVNLWGLKPKTIVPVDEKAQRIAYLKEQIALLTKELNELEGK